MRIIRSVAVIEPDKGNVFTKTIKDGEQIEYRNVLVLHDGETLESLGYVEAPINNEPEPEVAEEEILEEAATDNNE